MCGRYYVEADDMTLEIMQVIEEINRKKLNKHTGKDVVPTDYAPVITRQGITAMQWGFTLPDRKVPIINARSETAADKPLFSSSVQYRRCLLPASGYYEWDQQRNKYTIGHGKPFYIAGIFRPEDDHIIRFCIMTQTPVPALTHIHDRMPVILQRDAAKAWLNGSLPPQLAFQHVPPGIIGRTDVTQMSLFE